MQKTRLNKYEYNKNNLQTQWRGKVEGPQSREERVIARNMADSSTGQR